MTLKDLESRRYTYCQVFLGGRGVFAAKYFLVPTACLAEARPRAFAFAERMWPGQVDDIVFYPRNYIVAARRLFADGMVEGEAPARSALSDLL